MTAIVQAKARRTLGRRSRYRGGAPKQVVSISLTRERVAQLDDLTTRVTIGNRSEFVEALIWWVSRQTRLLR